MMQLSPSGARIGIVGAGPGGLTCAAVLARHGIKAVVFDADAGPQVRDQGGSLDLRVEDGQFALAHAGLLDAFHTLARPEGQEMRRLGIDGMQLDRFTPGADDRYKPEIDRLQLRDLLLDSLEPGTVAWGRKLVTVTDPVDGVRSLRFADGSSVDCDLVIGADGAFSRVRSALSAAVPSYTGLTFVEARFDDVDTRHPDLAALVGPGAALAADGDRGVFAQRSSGGQVRAYLMQRLRHDWVAAAGLRIDDTPAVRARLLRAFAAWGPRMRAMITDNDGPYVDRPLLVLPVGHRWTHSPSATLLGDAAHLMPPVGVGVNLAMLDAAELALALVACPTIDDAVRAYESTMLPRSAAMSEQTSDAAEFLVAAA